MEPYLFHGFRDYNVETVYKVLESGFILPRKMITNGAKTDCNNIFNGNAWISLSQKSLVEEHALRRGFRECYSEWITDHLCVVIKNGIEGIMYTDYVDRDECYSSWRKKNVYDENPRRFSYYLDEVQTNVPVPTSSFLAIGYPIYHFSAVKSLEDIEKDIEGIYLLLESKGLDIPVLNSSLENFADTKEDMIKSKIKRPEK